jgi:outer membrane immunogenic protein
MSRPLHSVILSVAIAATVLAVPCASSAQFVPPNLMGSGSANANSWLGGAQAGYNWQSGSVVYGVETDLSATHLESAMHGMLTFPLGFQPPSTTSTTATIDWYGTLRGRLGVATGPVLFYGTAGLAYGNVGLSSNVTLFGFPLNSQLTTVRTGWVAGGGVEYKLRPNLMLSLAYQYVDLGTVNVASTMTLFTLSQSASAHAQFQAVMAGLSWQFAPTGSSAPWQGAYAGGHVGGAWGLPADASYSGGVLISSDIRLKRDISLLGRRDDGLGIYRYKYLWSDTVYVGVMAQEVALIHPEAVVRDPLNGYLGVDYGRLGLSLTTLSE